MSKTPKLRFKEFSGDWEIHLLGKSITLYDNERKPVKEQERNSGEYAYYGATGIIDYIDDYIFEGEYLLLGEDGANIVTRNAPLIYKTEGKFWVNNHAHIFKPKSKFDIDFMKHRLELINYIPYNTGTAQPKLNADSIKSIPFNAPKLEEQEKIASFFSLIDSKISLQREKVEALKDYKTGMMQKIFSRELRFKDDEGRDYPEWEEKKLGDVGIIVTGNTPSTKEKDNYGDEYLWASPADLGYKKVIDDTINKLSFKGFDKIRKVPKGSILATCIGSTIGKIGMASMEMSTNQQINTLICNKDINNEFVYYSLEYNFPRYLSYVTAQAVPIINKTQFQEFDINVPVLDEQIKIGKTLSKIDLKIEKEQEKLDSLNQYKKGLLQQMFV